MPFFPGALLELIAEARLNPGRVPVALISFGVVLSAAALALIIFKAPGGREASFSDCTAARRYYGVLTVVAIFGLTEASFGYWMVSRDVDGWHAAGKTVLWVSLLTLVLLFALGGLAFLNPFVHGPQVEWAASHPDKAVLGYIE